MSKNKFYIAEAPSNIAFQKYWGKVPEEEQRCTTASISMSLSSALTRTQVRLSAEDAVWFEGELRQDKKIIKALDIVRSATPYKGGFEVKTQNSFPFGCGIASSASGMAALTLASIAATLNTSSMLELSKYGWTRSRLADLARRCSGSAGRSMWGGFVSWQAGPLGTVRQEFGADHWSLQDLIVLVDSGEKATPSSAGHLLASTSPLYETRVAHAQELHQTFLKAIEQKNLDVLGPLLEQEALNMHAVMLTSEPPLSYISAETSELLSFIRTQRAAGNFKAWFTLDAGPNPHIICDQKNGLIVAAALNQSFPQYEVLWDRVGRGPTLQEGEESRFK